MGPDVDAAHPARPARRLARPGLLALTSLIGWGASLTGVQAESLQEPLLPQPASLAPVETEAFRERYGQEALFRLKLGVESGERSRAPGVAPGGSCEGGWANSPQARSFQARLTRQQWYDAGEALGAWRRQCGVGVRQNGAP